MTHDTPLIATIAVGLSLAFLLGLVAHRLKLPLIAGYLLAGVILGPFTPGWVADQEIAAELAEMGVILLMFGVGLHFSLADLLAVKAAAVPGAIGQIAVATAAGTGLGMLLGDKYEKRYVAALCMLGHAAGLLLLTFATTVFEVAGFALLHGVAWGLRGPFMQAIRADYFGRNAIGIILGLSAAVTALGQMGGPMVAGILADLTGNYRWGFSVLALAAACGSVLFLLARPPVLPVAVAR